MQKQKSPPLICGGRPFRFRFGNLGHGPARGMVVMMMPGVEGECHEEKL
jgi:hypothetical protein